MHDNRWGLPVIVALILLIAVVEFVLPQLKKKSLSQQEQTQTQPQSPQEPPQTPANFSQLFYA